MQSALENLKAAISVIREASDALDLKRAEEVRDLSALQILSETVDEHARELVKLNQRRQQLLESIHGFLETEISIDGHVRKPEVTRLISAALLDQSIAFDEPRGAIAAAMEHWSSQFKALLSN